MKHITVILILLFNLPTHLWSQDNLWNGRENIILQYESYADTTYQYVILDKTNFISVGIYGKDSLEIDHFIRPYSNGSIDNESICDSMIIHLLCKDCIEFHLNKAINSKERHWIKLSDTLYVSPRWLTKTIPADKTGKIYTLPVMTISNIRNSTTITLFTQKVTKKKRKELKKGAASTIN